MDIRTMSTLELITRLNEAKTQLEMLVANGYKIIEEEKKKENL